MKTKILLVGIASFMLFSCSGDKQAQLTKLKIQHDKIADKIAALEKEVNATTEKKDNRKIVSVEEVKLTTFNHYIDVQGRLDGDENVMLTSPMGGTVKVIYVKAGETVKKDQIIAELDHDAQSAQLKALEIQLALTTDVFNRTQKLWDQKIGSEVQYLQAKAAKENLESNVKAVREQVEMLILRSPINGAVEDMPLKVGQMAAASIPSTYVKVVGFGKIKVLADVAEGYAAKIKEGDKVSVFFPDLNKELSASVNFASRYISPINRSFLVEANLQGELPSMKANMIVVLKIVDYHNDKAISVPFNYIQGDKKGYYLFLEQDGKAKKMAVKIGQIYNGTAEIIEGVKAGDKMITSGYSDLEDGQAIKF